MGMPKRVASLSSQLEHFTVAMGGDKAIHSVLVANNGLAAVKFMRSIRSWAYNEFSNERAITIVAMATPEDMRVDAEHIRMADQFVEVPGGSNNNNYANVRLIVQTAEKAAVDAVWPGWGHASEVPDLPLALSKTASGIRFLGPSAAAMSALGDKVGSTILAQAAGVPTLPWSGSHVSLSYEQCGGSIPTDVYTRACVHSLEEALQCCQRIGYPCMVKASWGGGGKGIRKVLSDEEVRMVFKQVQGEVPGSPIFCMKLAPQSRHLEVQLLCDRQGNVASLFSRDCSVQRRHQKIVEEGPVSVAPPETLQGMEACARALARSVGYVGAATVEFLYGLESRQYYFLELNPRLQVEHPVTEGISSVNIPAAQLMIGMGIPLWAMPSMRQLYGLEAGSEGPFDMEMPQAPPRGHVLGVRVTSEDADDGFKPSCGVIEELSFRNSPHVWGYFSVKSGGGIHEFSDSQFGHLFAQGQTREAAIRAMVVALKDIKIRGEIRSIVDYAVDMIQHPDFVGNSIHTTWLDNRIATNVKAERPEWYLAVVCGALLRVVEEASRRAAEYMGFLEKGQLPPARLTLTSFTEDLCLEGVKYTVGVTRRAPDTFSLWLNGSRVDAVARRLNDGGLLVQVDGQAHVVHSEEEPQGTRVTIDSLTCLLANEADPSRLLAASPGKLVRYLVEDGSQVQPDQAYAEVEVMKMVMPLLSPAAGKLIFQLPEGSILNSNDLIARLELDSPDAVVAAEQFKGTFPELGPPQVSSHGVDHRFQQARTAAEMTLAGFHQDLDAAVEELMHCLKDPALPLLHFNEVFAVVQNRLPAKLSLELQGLMGEFEADIDLSQGRGNGHTVAPHSPAQSSGRAPQFPSQPALSAMEAAVQEEGLTQQDRTALKSALEPLQKILQEHRGGRDAYARQVCMELMEEFLRVEERFQRLSEATEQEVIDSMRQVFSSSLQQVVDIVVSHQALREKCKLVSLLLDAIVRPAPELFRPQLRRMTFLLGIGSTDLAAKAQQLLESSMQSELRSLVARALTGDPSLTVADLEHLLGSGLGLFRTASASPAPSLTGGMRSPRALPASYGHAGSPPAAQADGQVQAKLRLVVESSAAVDDALAILMCHSEGQVQVLAMQAYILRIYQPYLSQQPEVHPPAAPSNGHEMLSFITWTCKGPPPASGMGCAVALQALKQLQAALSGIAISLEAHGGAGQQRGTLHIVLVHSDAAALTASPEAQKLEPRAAAAVATLLQQGSSAAAFDNPELLIAIVAQVMTVSDFIFDMGFYAISVLASCQQQQSPLRVGFWRQQSSSAAAAQPDTDLSQSGFKLDPLLCNVEPVTHDALELTRLRSFVGRLTYTASPQRQCHTWTVMERPNARSIPLKRVFLRAFVRQLPAPQGSEAPADVATAAMQVVERELVGGLEDLDRVRVSGTGRDSSVRPDWAHLFLSVLPPLPLNAGKQEEHIAGALRAAGAAIMSRHGSTLRQAAVAQWEVRFRAGGGAPAWRVVGSSPTGHESGEEDVQVYQEGADDTPQVYSSVHAGQPSAGPLHGQSLLSVYGPLEHLQQKRLAARLHKTTFCYDFPRVFENALREIWDARAAAGEPQSIMPARLVETQELVMGPDGSFRLPAALRPLQRPMGQNDVGIVAWHMVLRTPECPEGRQVIAIANDITYNSGAFGPREDAIFRAATEHALQHELPIVYLAANSGARVGLAAEVKQCLQVEWVQANDPSKGFKYLYLSDADYRALTQGTGSATLRAQPLQAEGQKRWQLTDVVGAEDGLGVECLSGSGAIASAYARAFREGFTLTLVSGRSVGIGAYLARLGRRCIQRADQPIILTGYSALNKLLGRDVYSSHLQLGGPKVMGVNGVSHQVVPDDLAGVAAVLRWLSYVPPSTSAIAPLLPSRDPEARLIQYAPAAGEKLDPRAAIAGIFVQAQPSPFDNASSRPTAGQSQSGDWRSGLFDRDSWTEVHAGWARSVVTGRARLGGTPCGVIAVETQTVMLNVPADPGMPDSAERTIPQAGQVWFPDSALKTAQAMEEFDREQLPLFILANWRGFSGGQRDLFEGILQAGSLIVEQLRTYRQPVTIYLPPGAELRGGAWVVIDGQINSDMVEMYADPAARGGVLEPEGVVEIKFRKPDLIAAMHRLDPVLQQLKAGRGVGVGVEGSIKAREALLLPVYRQVAVAFAEMHDTPVRMVAKGVLRGIVPWPQARPFMIARLRRRLAEEHMLGAVRDADPSLTRQAVASLLRTWFCSTAGQQMRMTGVRPAPPVGIALRESNDHSLGPVLSACWEDDAIMVRWLLSFSCGGAPDSPFGRELQILERKHAASRLKELVATPSGREGLLLALEEAAANEPKLKQQLLERLTGNAKPASGNSQ